MLTISQSYVVPLPTSSRCVPNPSGFPVQMRHGHGCAGVGHVDGADRFVGGGSEGRGGDQSAGAKSAAVSSPRQTSDPHFPERRTVACRYVRPNAAVEKYADQPLQAGNLPTERKSG